MSMEDQRYLPVTDRYPLTPVSRRLYRALTNPENFDKNVTEMCKSAKVSRDSYYRLMKDEKFVSWVRETQRSYVESQGLQVLSASLKYALEKEGFQDRKLILTWMGEYEETMRNKVEGDLDIKGSSEDLMKYLTEDITDGETVGGE